ncbi:hypothetical protein KVR01_006496 [Diaporthe batatas]|uniref:uncharacterized protein n=1 Tax=Diaporthe batatas TaxID=748121 RepID=UPI001D059305|nr:uncharacterized protein KVR01_006496 [Diaporthe batatas]KAG8163199.1 hypothetical protein KVR01_006496 [Diaporthe batatas]
MASKKIITVFGATGKQGGSIVRTFLNDPKLKDAWAVRGVSRSVEGEGAKKLSAQGVEVVAANLNDKPSLVKAMTGAAAVFAMTNYWEKMDMQLEIQQGKNLADAAKEAGVNHYIWSSLLNVTKLTNGKLPHVHHFDSKALDAPFPVFDAGEDTGKWVKAIVLQREKLLGKRVYAATAYLTPLEMIAGFKKVFPQAGASASFLSTSHEQFVGALTGSGMPEEETSGGEDLSLDILEDKPTTWEEHLRKSPATKDLQ